MNTANTFTTVEVTAADLRFTSSPTGGTRMFFSCSPAALNIPKCG